LDRGDNGRGGGSGSAFCTGAITERGGKVHYFWFYRGGNGREIVEGKLEQGRHKGVGRRGGMYA
jgi:hypothetical protein